MTEAPTPTPTPEPTPPLTVALANSLLGLARAQPVLTLVLALIALMIAGAVLLTDTGRKITGLPSIGEQAASAADLESQLGPIRAEVERLGRRLEEETEARKKEREELTGAVDRLTRSLEKAEESRRRSEEQLIEAIRELKLKGGR